MVCVGLLILCFSRIKHPVAKGRLGVVDGSLLQVFTSSEATKTVFPNLIQFGDLRCEPVVLVVLCLIPPRDLDIQHYNILQLFP